MDKAPDINEISAIVVHTDLKEHGRFTCSDQLINKIQECVLNSTLTNFHGIPTDCPHREKNGWTGDANLSAEQALINFDIAAAYSKWLVDFLDVQRKSGQLPGIVPTSSWGYNWGSGPAWDSAIILMPWSIYVYTGDKQILKTMYFGMKKYMDYIESMTVDNLVEFGLGDWCPPEGSVKTPTMLTDTGYYYVCSQTMAKIADVLGKKEESKHYSDLTKKIRKAFYDKFINLEEGIVGSNNQTSFSCALYQNIAYEGDRKEILSYLLKEIERCDYHIDCGILGAKYVMQSLAQMGRSDIAFKIATQDTYPGWGHWIKSGATSLWEDWEGKNSLNHHMFSDISAFFYKGLAGIVPDETAPGFKHFYIQPSFVDGLDWVKAWHDSPYGRIISELYKNGNDISLRVSVPVNTTATVRNTIGDASIVTIKGEKVSQNCENDDNKYEIVMGSGQHIITYNCN